MTLPHASQLHDSRQLPDIDITLSMRLATRLDIITLHRRTQRNTKERPWVGQYAIVY